MAEGESAEKHLLNMSELYDRLAALELPVPEEFQPLMILASLPASYTAIVQTLGSQAEKLDLSHVSSTIIDEDARRRGSGTQDDQALVSHGDNHTGIPPKESNATIARRWGISAMTAQNRPSNTTNQLN